MVREIDTLRKANESLGGVFEVQAFGLVPGLGSHISWEERLDGRLAMAICSIQALKGVSIGDAFRVAGLPGSRGPRRDLLLAGARLLPHDEQLRRARGRHDDRRAARRARRDEAAAHAHPAAALRGHRDARARAGAARAHRLLHGARRGRRRRGDGRARARGRIPAQVRRRPRRRPARSRSPPTGSGSDGIRPDRLHGRGQVDRCPGARGGARLAGPRQRRAARAAARAFGGARSSEAAGEAAFRAREEALVGELLAARRGAGRDRARRRERALGERPRCARGAHERPARDLAAERMGARAGVGRGRGAPARGEPRAVRGRSTRSAWPLYEELADAIVAEPVAGAARAATEGIPRALGALAAAPAGTRMLWARSASGEYPVLVGGGLLGGEQGLAERIWPLARERSRAFCVSDEAVASLYGARARRARRGRSRSRRASARRRSRARKACGRSSCSPA